MARLDGRTALVTGAAQGIGRAVSHRLATEGAAVILCDTRAEQLRRVCDELDGDGDFVCTDVTDTAGVMAGLRGRTVDILVNNAAIAPRIPLAELTPAELERVMAVNFQAAVFLSRAVGSAMCEEGAGSIVNISSVNAFRGQTEMLHYNASKAALVSLTQTMAMEYAAFGVRVNCICPGSTWTDAWEDGGWTDADKQQFTDKIPLHRFGTPQEIAAGVAFLAGDDSSYVTGQALRIDGGLTARM